MDVTSAGELPLTRVGEIEPRRETGWLVESLWLDRAAGLIGGQPKCCKSWLGLDMAVSIASGTPCLGRFAVKSTGPALVYLAEDGAEQVRKRVEAICNSRGLDIRDLNVTVITAPVLRLDIEEDRARLWRAVERVRPRMLLLDPLVRLHRLDENNSRDIAGILGFLREIQRRSDAAVVLTHHASKRATSRPGQGLRGSSDLHAFGDSNLYLSRHNDDLVLAVEHRSAVAIDPLRLTLAGKEDVHLEVTTTRAATKAAVKESLADRIIQNLEQQTHPVTRNDLRAAVRSNNQRFVQALTALLADGRVVTTSNGITLNHQ